MDSVWLSCPSLSHTSPRGSCAQTHGHLQVPLLRVPSLPHICSLLKRQVWRLSAGQLSRSPRHRLGRGFAKTVSNVCARDCWKFFSRASWGPLVPFIEARVVCRLSRCTAVRAPAQWEESAKLRDVIDVCAKQRTFVFLSLWLMLSLIIEMRLSPSLFPTLSTFCYTYFFPFSLFLVGTNSC